MSTIFSTASDARTRARKNVRIIAQIVHREYFPLPRFRVQCFADFPGYWRALQKHHQTDSFIIDSGYQYLQTDLELHDKTEKTTPPAFLRRTTICIAPRLWRQVATLPTKGVVTLEQWILTLVCAHEVFHLHNLVEDPLLYTSTYILEQALADLGALDMMLRYAPLDQEYFAEHSDDLFERVKGCLDYTAGPDVAAGGQEYPRLLATLLLMDADYDREAAYQQLRAVYRQADGIQVIEGSFRRAIEGLSQELDMGDLAERAFETNPGRANPVTAGMVAVVNGYYDREMRARWDTDALLALLELGTFYHYLHAPPTLETLQAQLDALHDVRPSCFSPVDQILEKKRDDE